MTVFYAALLGIIQGLTEFLPVSSSAHLILARAFFGWDADQFGLAFDVACHVGTLLAVLVYFRRDVIEMVLEVPRFFGPSSPARLMRLIAVGTVPAVVVGVVFGDVIETRLRVPEVAAAALAVGGFALLAAERLGRRSRDEGTIGALEALAIGAAQACALVPGVSRSGATIALGMWMGLRRESIARFSFLLGIPAILGAGAREALALRRLPFTPDVQLLFLVGIVSSAVVGYLTIRFFLRFLARHSLDVFAYYRLALAAAVPVWQAL